MTDKQKIRAEIESSMKACEEAFNICPSTAFGSRIDSYKALLSFIDSLPEEPVSEDLEEEIENYIKDSLAIKFPTTDKEQIKADIRYIARHFAEWQRKQLMKELWHKDTDYPGNKHPYPVINPDTQEMAFAYYYYGWNFDRDYNPGCNMLWLDIEKILPDFGKEVSNEPQ